MGHKKEKFKDGFRRDGFRRDEFRRKVDEDDISSAVVYHVLARLENPNDPLGRQIRAWPECALDFVLGLLGGRAEPREDPAVLLRQAQQEMGQSLAVNRTRAAEVRVQRDELQTLVAQTQTVVDDLQARAEATLRGGNRALAHDLLTEKQHYVANLSRMKDLLQTTVESMRVVEAALRGEEERIRMKTAEALALKAQWNQSQIDLSLRETLDGMKTRGTEGFERAEAQVSQAHSESAAHRELDDETLDRGAARNAAETELAALEQRLGVTPTGRGGDRALTGPASAGDLDQRLQNLEARIVTSRDGRNQTQ